MTNETQFFRKIYLSHFIRNGTKGLWKGYVWEVSWKLNKDCNILTPSSSGYNSTSFSFSHASQPAALRAQPLLGPVSHSSNCNNWLQTLISNKLKLPVAPGYIIIWCPPVFSEHHICTQFNPLFTQVHFLFDSSVGSEVNMLHLHLLFHFFIQQCWVYWI